MKQEDIENALGVIGKGGVNVAGDLVLEKHVEYEVNNVEAGGIGIQIVNGNTHDGRNHAQPSDEQVSRAISAINGQILNNYQRWFGVVHYLSTMCGWPSNPMECCKRINQLPGHERWEWACKYENIRKFPSDKYGRIPYSEWDEYKPKDDERRFLEFRDVARAFEEQLQREMQQ